MSDAEASLVRDLASSIVAVLDTAAELCSNIKDVSDVPGALRDSSQLLPTIQDALRAFQTHVRTNSEDDEACRETQPILRRCLERALQLETVFRKVTPHASTPRHARYLLIAHAPGKDSRVETLVKEMLEDVKLLAERPAARPGMEAEVEKLAKAIERVLTLALPTPEDALGGSVNNKGSRTTNANTGSGTANIHSGSGQQYVAQNQFFGRTLDQLVLLPA
jgi:hypothetical protein